MISFGTAFLPPSDPSTQLVIRDDTISLFVNGLLKNAPNNSEHPFNFSSFSYNSEQEILKYGL